MISQFYVPKCLGCGIPGVVVYICFTISNIPLVVTGCIILLVLMKIRDAIFFLIYPFCFVFLRNKLAETDHFTHLVIPEDCARLQLISDGKRLVLQLWIP